MLRINRLTDYGTLVLTYLASHPEQMRSANDVAIALGLGAPTVSKILKTLGRHELVRSNRGFRGGYSLSRAPETISVADIIDALEEQPFGLTECSASEGVCSFESNCRIRTSWQRINDIVRRTLEDVSLVDMMQATPVRDSEVIGRGKKAKETMKRTSAGKASVRMTRPGAGSGKKTADVTQVRTSTSAPEDSSGHSGALRTGTVESSKPETQSRRRAERTRMTQL